MARHLLSHLAQRGAKPVILGVTALLLALTGIVIVFVQDQHIAHAQGNQYYVNCSASSNGNGSQGSPWNSVQSVNNHGNFSPGDTIFFNRGSYCAGSLQPQGSGSTGEPITLDAYGSGAQPIIDGGSSVTNTFELNGQQYWVIQNLEFRGGLNHGVYITGTPSTTSTPLVLNYFRLNNLTVDNVNPTVAIPDANGTGGLVNIEPIYGPNGSGDTSGLDFVDVVLNNIQASNTGRFDGIRIGNGGNTQRGTSNVTVENSTVHDTAGNGIYTLGLTNGVMQNNVVYNNGKFSGTCSVASDCPSPVGLWDYQTNGVIAQGNEVYDDMYPRGADGGGYDIDFSNTNNTYQYNYAHDNDGYCLTEYQGQNSIIRYNVCANNAQVNVTGSNMSDLQLFGNSNVQVYNNTIYSHPTANNPVIKTTDGSSGSAFSGNSFIKNNLIYATNPYMLYTTAQAPAPPLDNNLWWYTGSGSPTWTYNSTTYTGFSAYQSGSGQDAHGKYADPLLNNPTYHAVGKPTSAFTLQSGSPALNAGTNVCVGISGCDMGTRDFFGNSTCSTSSHNIGAYESAGCSGGGGSTNLALNKSARASSIYSSDYDASKADDGLTNTGWSPMTSDTGPYWEVDLGQAYTLTQIQLVTRQDIDQPVTRQNFAIWASNNNDMSLGHVVLCTQGSTPLPYQATFNCAVTDTTAYRYVAAVKTVSEYFFITELQVFGSGGGGGSQNLIQDPGYEQQTSGSLSSPWIGSGSLTGVDLNKGLGHSGANEAWIYAEDTNWHGIAQNVTVQPNTNYTLTVYIKTSGTLDTGNTYFGVYVGNGQPDLQQTHYNNAASWTQLTLTFNSGGYSTVQPYIGYFTPSSSWMLVDDWTLQAS